MLNFVFLQGEISCWGDFWWCPNGQTHNWPNGLLSCLTKKKLQKKREKLFDEEEEERSSKRERENIRVSCQREREGELGLAVSTLYPFLGCVSSLSILFLALRPYHKGGARINC